MKVFLLEHFSHRLKLASNRLKLAKNEDRVYEGSGVMNSRPKQNPLRERTMAVIRERVGVSNSISNRSPGFSRIPAYNTMPPSLISVPRPSTTVVEKPLEVI